jgi:predicted DNA-binding protein YlxM (UPF0122 family)
MKDNTVEMVLLYDFFGELLTEKQRNCFDLYYNDDLSLSEIAEQAGITRQGVRDNIVHAEAALRRYEEKTGVVRRFTRMREQIAELEAEIKSVLADSGTDGSKAQSILTQLEELKGYD